MTLIKCPQCGHSVLSVASTCPNCARRLMPDPISAGGLNDLVECQRCGQLLDRLSAQCPNCAYPARRARLLRRAALFGAGAVVVLAIWMISLKAPPAAPSPDPSPSAVPLEPQPLAPPEPAPIDVAALPDTATAPSPIPDSVARPVRWTVNWANVREGRAGDAPVVRILRPGERVEVDNLVGGWWAVFADGLLVGYVARDLLDTVPPPIDGR